MKLRQRRSTTALLFIAASIIVTVLWILTDVPALAALGFAALIAWQAIAGYITWRSIRPSASPLEHLGMALALGTAMATLAGLVTSTSGLGPWGSLLPTGIALTVTMFRKRTQRTIDSREAITPTSLIGFLIAVVTGLAVFLYALSSYPLQWVGSWLGYHPDVPFFEALAHSLARFGALESPFMSGGVVRYHWLSYAWSGQLSVMTDAEPFVALTRVLPIVTLVGSAAIVVAWSSRLSRVWWTPILAGLLLTLSGFTGAVYGGVLTMDSPSQAMAVLWLLGFSLLVVEIARRPQSSPRGMFGPILLVAVMAIAMTGGKVSAAAPAVAGTLLMVVVLLAKRLLSVQQATSILAATLLGSVTAFLLFLAGSVGGGGLTIGSLIDRAASLQGVNPLDGPRGVLLGTAILTLAILPRWTGLTWLAVDRRWRWRPETWLSIGMAVSSLLALLAFNSFNEIWFSSTVSGPLAAMTAVGTGLAYRSLTRSAKDRQRIGAPILLTTGIVALSIVAVVWMVWLTGASGGNVFVGTGRWLGPPAAWIMAICGGLFIGRWAAGRWSIRAAAASAVIILVFTSVPGRLLGAGSDQVGVLTNGARAEWFSITRGLPVPTQDREVVSDWTSTRMDAARWVRANTDTAALIATNLTLSPFVAGTTLRPTYASGLLYQIPYGTQSMEPEILLRERQSWAFIDDPSEANVAPLCAAGVRVLWVDLSRTEVRDWAPFADIQIQTADSIIATLRPGLCAPTLP